MIEKSCLFAERFLERNAVNDFPQASNLLADDGTHIDVQVRLSRTGSTQMFIGVYATSGMAIHEEAFDSRPGESMTRALAWGVGRARRIASDAMPVNEQFACSK